MRGTVLLALMAGLLASGAGAAEAPAPAPATAVSAERTEAHARTLDLARTALAKLAALREAAPKGLSDDYLDRLQDYESARNQVFYRVDDEAWLDPEVAPLRAAYDQAYAEWVMLGAAADTTAVALAEADDRRHVAGKAQLAGKNAAAARLAAELAAQGFVLPASQSRELWAKDQTEAVQFPRPVPVFGGVEPPPGATPWQVELQWADVDDHVPKFADEDLHACGGSLIAADWVLTAAHCVWDLPAQRPYPTNRLRVRAGSNDLSQGMQAFAIDAVRVPTGALAYVPSSAVSPARNDIALVHLATRAPLTDPMRIARIPLAREGFEPPTTPSALSVTGWGATVTQSLADQSQRMVSNGRLHMSPSLQAATLGLIANADCTARIGERVKPVLDAHPELKVTPLPDSVLCAGAETMGTCLGDSGGPLVAARLPAVRRLRSGRTVRTPGGRVLVGVVSWGVGCKGFSVFTRVSAYDAWIRATIAPLLAANVRPSPGTSGLRAPGSPGRRP